MHAATTTFPTVRPPAPAPRDTQTDGDARLITEILARLWELVGLPDTDPRGRPVA